MLRFPDNPPGRIFLLLFSIGLTAACGDDVDPTDPDSEPGTLEVSATTTGEDPDPDGYTLALEDGSEETIGTDGTVRIADIEPGTYTLEISGVAANCAVEGENPRTVEVLAGELSRVDLQASCEPAEGALEITTETTGADVDADGYVVTVDAMEVDSIGVADTVTLEGLDTGGHDVELTGVAANCEVDDANPHAAEVVYDTTTEVTIGVVCAYNRLVFQTDRNGVEDIFVMNSDGSDVHALTTADTADDENPSWSPDGSAVLFDSDRDGDGDIYTIQDDGSGLTNVTDDDDFNGYPDWSPNGDRFVFRSTRSGSTQLHIADADGSNVTQVTSVATGFPIEAAWSPDGSRIAFTWAEGTTSDIYTIAPDGSDLQQVTDDPDREADPSWSPDGSRIAFESDRNFGDDLYVIDADGSNEERLTFDMPNSFAPSWRHDGRIAFSSDRSDLGIGIYIMDANGDDVQEIQDHPDQDVHPDWTP